MAEPTDRDREMTQEFWTSLKEQPTDLSLVIAAAREEGRREPRAGTDALVEALRPFAVLLDTDRNGYEDSPDAEVVRSVGTLGRDYAFITVADLRRARAALEAIVHLAGGRVVAALKICVEWEDKR